MKKRLTVEPGKESVTGHCDTCGHESRVFRGFVYSNNAAYAVYAGNYTQSHPELGVSMAVSLAGWGEGADEKLKECVALEWRKTDTGPGCAVVDGPSTTWASEPILGRMLTRAEAMSSGRAKEAFEVTDAIWASDSRLAGALAGS